MRFKLILPAFLLASATLAHAGTAYTYSGVDFTTAFAPYTTSDSVSGSFTLQTPLGDNLNGAMITPAVFSFSDGVDTINSSADYSAQFEFTTNALGNIIDYNILVTSADQTDQIEIAMGPQFSSVDGDFGANATGSGYNFTSGTLAVSPGAAPEPSSLILLGTGMAELAGLARRRFV